mmetsp:Transcript_25270/g.38801  ORF Transcript_25270/g.38801 Transcript_25270/m.38801 type:complete len:99 (+) Transcript_25270:207-503(+)
MSTEVLLIMAERLSNLLKNDKEKIRIIIELIFLHMIEIDSEVDADWESPKEGFNEDFEEVADIEVVRFGMNAIDRLIGAFSEKDMIPLLSSIVQSMLA